MVKPKRGGDPTVVDLSFVRRARDAAERNAPSPDELAAVLERDQRLARASMLDAIDPAITADDIMAIITDTLDETPPLVAAKEFLESDKDLLILTGDFGVGKTVAGCWILARRGGEFVSAKNLAAICTSYTREDKARAERIMTCRSLLIDEVCTEADAAKLEPWLFETTNRRRSRGRNTIWTTTKSPDFVKDRYPYAPLWDRVRQCCFSEEFTGPSLRGAK